MKETIVTGASGFLGSHLTQRLEGYTAIPHQQISTSHYPDFKKFFFCSAYGNMTYHSEGDKILQANLLDLIHILRQIDVNKAFDSFVYLSSSSTRLKRQTMYSRTKRAAEEVLLSYKEKYNLPICIVRPFSVTGVGEQSQHLIPTLIRSCITGEPMDFVPRPVHDFIDVEDVVDGIINLSTHSAKGVFELGTGVSHTNQEVKELVEKVTGKKAKVNVVDSLREYDVHKNSETDWVSSNFRARMYGWLARKSLETSIAEMVEAYTQTDKQPAYSTTSLNMGYVEPPGH